MPDIAADLSPRFVQLHLLTFHAPANLNRDDTGRPKTATIGGAERLRVSSQAIKRAVRTSDAFREALEGKLGERTQRLGEEIVAALAEEGVDEATALKAARDVAGLFGKLKGEKDKTPARIEQLAFVGPQERDEAFALARRVASGDEVDVTKERPLRRADGAADIAMFGRMLADAPAFNREAAVQVAHAFTTHAAPVESDYYTAVDDLKRPEEDAGAGFIGTTGFGSGVFYLYVCVDRALLVANLDGDEALAGDAIGALAQGLATVSPSGKQASFASRARASFVLAERGDQQPRNLAAAFLKPVRASEREPDLMASSVDTLLATRARMDEAYGACAEAARMLDLTGRGDGVETAGTLDDLVAFAAVR